MRNNIVHPGADELIYEIRKIVEVGENIEKTGVKIIWDNIGDPVAKGQIVPQWIKEIVATTVINDNPSFGYSPTKGLLATREYIARERNLEGGAQIIPDDILFFNGLGDAISTVYNYLHKSARVIGPNPAYSTHSSAEAAHSGSPHITYRLNPKNNWYPDIDDLNNQSVALKTLLQYNLQSVRAYLLREEFQQFWSYISPHWTEQCLDEWITKTMLSKIDHMKKLL